MAFGATTYLVSTNYEARPGREYQAVEVDSSLSTVAQTAPRQLVPIYDNEGIEVVGVVGVTAGSTNAVINIGVYTAAAAEGDLDYFLDSVDVAADTFYPAGATGTQYINVTGATQYLAVTSETADDAAGKYRVIFRKFPVTEVAYA